LREPEALWKSWTRKHAVLAKLRNKVMAFCQMFVEVSHGKLRVLTIPEFRFRR
jgi:hypothetical protein